MVGISQESQSRQGPSPCKGKWKVVRLASGETGRNVLVYARQAVGIFLSSDNTCGSHYVPWPWKGGARALDLGQAWERHFGPRNAGCI